MTNKIQWIWMIKKYTTNNKKNQGEVLNLNTLILFLVFAVIHLPNLCYSHSVAMSSSLNSFMSVTIPFIAIYLSLVIPFISLSIPQILTTLSVPPEAIMFDCFKVSKAQIQPWWASAFLNTGLLLLVCHKLIDPSIHAEANRSWLIERTLSIAYSWPLYAIFVYFYVFHTIVWWSLPAVTKSVALKWSISRTSLLCS